jgi:hypothetical protein
MAKAVVVDERGLTDFERLRTALAERGGSGPPSCTALTCSKSEARTCADTHGKSAVPRGPAQMMHRGCREPRPTTPP